MTINETHKLIQKTIKWTMAAYAEIEKAGGLPESVLRKFDQQLLDIMIRNNIYLVYRPDDRDQD